MLQRFRRFAAPLLAPAFCAAVRQDPRRVRWSPLTANRFFVMESEQRDGILQNRLSGSGDKITITVTVCEVVSRWEVCWFDPVDFKSPINHTRTMLYQLQIQYEKQGDWENTVFLPMPLMRALDVMATHNILWSKEHGYRLVEVKKWKISTRSQKWAWEHFSRS